MPIPLCKKAINIQPGIVDMYTNVAAGYLSLGKSDSGIAYLYKAIGVDDSYLTSYQFLATAYKTAGNIDSAQKYEAIMNRKRIGG
jgi:Tfp pilus assembly protein PilF